MSRSVKKKTKSRISQSKRFRIETMEARRLMAADVAIAADDEPVEVDAIAPPAIVGVAQTREHILLARQTGVPANTREAIGDNVNVSDADKAAWSGFVPGDKLADPTRDDIVDPEVPQPTGLSQRGTTVETADEVLAPELETEPKPTGLSQRGTAVETADEVLAPELETEPKPMGLSQRGSTVETADEVLAPELETEPKPTGLSQRGTTVETADEVLAPELETEPKPTGLSQRGTTVETADEVLAPELETEPKPTGLSQRGTTVETADEVLAPELETEPKPTGLSQRGTTVETADEVLAPELETEPKPTGLSQRGTTVETANEVLAPDLGEGSESGDGFVPDDKLEDPKNDDIVDPKDPSPIEGDVDGDGTVGFNDFLVIANNFGDEVGSRSDGDLTNDGVVDFADFLELARNFGSTAQATDAVFASFA